VATPASPGRGRPAFAVSDTVERVIGFAALTVLLLGVLVALRATVAVPVRISSSSMVPTLLPGDVVLVSEGTPTLPDVHRGDLVTFTSPQDGERALKRVVGLPGDSVVILDSVLHVNDQPVAEPYVDHALIDGYYSATAVVPPGTVFLLGDNRGNSVDSRDYGPVPLGELTGEVVVRLWPPVRVGGPQPSPPKS
jgi:signal peptidase I